MTYCKEHKVDDHYCFHGDQKAKTLVRTDFCFGPDGDLWSSSGPATAEQKMKFVQQRRIAIDFVRAFIDEMDLTERKGTAYTKAKAFLFDVDHS